MFFWFDRRALPEARVLFLHPLRVHNVTRPAETIGAIMAPAKLAVVRPGTEKPAPFPRHIDRIATEAQGRFVLILGACTLLTLFWSMIVQIDKVTRASGRIVTQQTKQEV